jgi:O-antigen ligase
LVCRSDDARRPIHAATAALLLHILVLFAYQIWIWAHSGTYPLGTTPFAEKDYHSMLVTTLSALILADMLCRSILQRMIFPLPWPALAGILALSCIASVTLLARNAVIINALLVIASVLIFVVIKRKTLGRVVVPSMLVLFLVIGSLGWAGLRSDVRWQGFMESAAAALDTKTNMAWLDMQAYPLPLMKNGQNVDESAYFRLAWAKVGVEQIAQYPLGLGYGHKAFGWAVNRSYHVQTGHESSHCGLLDFTLANGIPGLILWLALSIALIVAGWRAFRTQQSPAGLALAFTVAAYLVRCLVDGHLSGFRLAMYAFLVGLLVMLQSIETKQCS